MFATDRLVCGGRSGVPRRMRALILGHGEDEYGNAFAGALPEEWAQATELEELRLASIGISGSVPESFSSLTKLRVFDAPNNKLAEFPDAPMWVELTSLAHLDLSSNSLRGEVTSAHLDAFGRAAYFNFYNNIGLSKKQKGSAGGGA